MYNRESLERQLADLEARKEALFESGNGDQVAISRLNEQITEVRRQLSMIDTKEAIIAEASDPESSFTLTVDGYTVDFRAESASEEAYQALRIVTQLKLQELEQQNQNEIRALKASYEADLAQRDQAAQQLRDNLHKAEIERGDYETKWDAARNERDILLTENGLMKGEIESLKTQVEDLRNQVSKPTVPTNMDNSALGEAMRKLKESKRAIYNVIHDTANINYTARFVDTNEEFTDKVVYIGKYRVLSEEEAARFRAELEATQTAIESAEEHSEDNTTLVTIESPGLESFRENEDDNTGRELDRDSTVSESGSNHDGGETFEQQVMRRLATLETAVYGEVREAA